MDTGGIDRGTRRADYRLVLPGAFDRDGASVPEGSAGGEGLLTARAHLLQSIWIFEEIGNDVELARSCRVYAALLRASPDFETDPNAATEAEQFAERAEEIFAKLKMSSHGFDADVFFKSRPVATPNTR